MTDLIAKLRLEATSTSFVSEVDKGASGLKKLDDAAGKAGAALEKTGKGAAVASAETRKATDSVEKQTAALKAQAVAERDAAAATEARARAVGNVSKAEANQRLNLARQGADVFTGLTTGQSPQMIAFQQGPQILEALAGAGFKASASMLAVGGAVAALGAGLITLIAAEQHAEQAQRALEVSARGLGAASGVTADQLEALAEKAGGASDLTVDKAREMAIAYANTGKIGGAVMADLISVTKDYAKTAGSDLDTATAQLAKAFADPAKGASDLNQALNFLSAAELEHIQNLAQTGDTAAAQALLVDQLKTALVDAGEATSGWSNLLGGLGDAAVDAFDAVGRALDGLINGKDYESKLAKLTSPIANLIVSLDPTGVLSGDILAQRQRLQANSPAAVAARQAAAQRNQRSNELAALTDKYDPRSAKLDLFANDLANAQRGGEGSADAVAAIVKARDKYEASSPEAIAAKAKAREALTAAKRAQAAVDRDLAAADRQLDQFEKQTLQNERQRLAQLGAVTVALDDQIASEKARAVAIAGGMEAEVRYAQAEAVRQEVQRAGKALSADEIKAVEDRIRAVQRLTAINDQASDLKAYQESLRLARLTNSERALEVRYLEIKRDLLATMGDAEAEAAARAQATKEAAQKEAAAAAGKFKDDIKQAFIDSGKISFDQLGDYATKALRAAIYKALLEKPISIVVDATVNMVEKAKTAVTDWLGKVSGSGGSGGSIASALSSLAAAAPQIAAAYQLAKAGTSLGGKLFGLSDYQQKAANKSADYGGGILVNLVVGLLSGKESNHGATANLDADGRLLDVTGSKRNADTEKGARSAAEAIKTGEKALRDAGLILTTTVKSVLIGGRDQSQTTLSNGTIIKTAVGDAGAAVDASLKALLTSAQYADPAMKAFVQGLIAAGRTIDEVITSIGDYNEVLGLEKSLRLELLKHTDNRAYQLQTLSDSQASRRAQVAAYNSQGLITPERLTAINTLLDQLDAAELKDALEGLGTAATEAGRALDAARPGLQAWLDQVMVGAASPLNPSEQRGLAYAQYERALEKARGGDAGALGDLTTYADRLLSADRTATSDAQARLELFNKVTGDVGALAAPGATSTPQAIAVLTSSNEQVTLEASAATTAAIADQTAALNASLAQLNLTLTSGLTALGDATVAGLGSTVAAAIATRAAVADLASETAAANAYARQAGARV